MTLCLAAGEQGAGKSKGCEPTAGELIYILPQCNGHEALKVYTGKVIRMS